MILQQRSCKTCKRPFKTLATSEQMHCSNYCTTFSRPYAKTTHRDPPRKDIIANVIAKERQQLEYLKTNTTKWRQQFAIIVPENCHENDTFVTVPKTAKKRISSK